MQTKACDNTLNIVRYATLEKALIQISTNNHNCAVRNETVQGVFMPANNEAMLSCATTLFHKLHANNNIRQLRVP